MQMMKIRNLFILTLTNIMKTIFSVLCLFLLFISCSNAKKTNYYLEEVEKWLGKTIIIPDSLPVYYENDIYSYSNDYIDTTKYHIISNIDGTCYHCIESFEIWKDIIDECPNDKVQFIFIINTNTPKKVLFFLESLNFNYPIIIDENGEFDNFNQLDDISNTVLTD